MIVGEFVMTPIGGRHDKISAKPWGMTYDNSLRIHYFFIIDNMFLNIGAIVED